MLPQQPIPLIGRDNDLNHILSLLTDPTCRLLTLIGVGGIGKTRLAIEAAERAASLFQDGTRFISLQSIDADTELVPTFANALGIEILGASGPRQQLIDYFQNRHLLLVIDNFEHLIDHIDLLVDLLNAPDIKLLVTSREALRVREEWLYAVEGLSVPFSDALDIDSYGAVQLFSEHVRRLRHNFVLDDHRADVIRICHFTEGHPLAIELSAGWIKALTPAQIATEMQSSLDFLTTNVRNVPERHRSMRAAFDQSWRLVGNDEAQVFRRLSIFRGGFTREAAEIVAGTSLHTLAALVDKSLLRVNLSSRYSVHELLRQFGEQQLATSGELDVIRDTHSNYYLDFLAQRSETIYTHLTIEILDEIEVDFENIRVAWYRAIDQKNYTAIGGAIEALSAYCDWRGRIFEHQTMFADAQERFAGLPTERPLLVLAPLLERYAAFSMVFVLQDDQIEAIAKPIFERSLEIALLYNDQFHIAMSTFSLAMFSAWKSQLEGLELLDRALLTFQQMGKDFYISEVLFIKAYLYRNIQQPELFMQIMQQSIDLKLQIGSTVSAANGIRQIAEMNFDEGFLAEAVKGFSQGLDLNIQAKNNRGIVMFRHRLALTSFIEGNFDEAQHHVKEILKLNVMPQDRYMDSLELATQLRLKYVTEENYSEALHLLEDFSESALSAQYLHKVAILCGLGNFQKAHEQFQLLLMLPETVVYQKFKAIRVLTIASLILANQGEEKRAVEWLSLLWNQPAEWIGWLKKWGLVQRLLTRLQTDLDEASYLMAWQRGQTFDLQEEYTSLVQDWTSPAKTLAGSPRLPDTLTERETEVLRLLAAGLSNRQIMRELSISLGTVKTHVHNIYGKLGVASRTQAIIHARELKLL